MTVGAVVQIKGDIPICSYFPVVESSNLFRRGHDLREAGKVETEEDYIMSKPHFTPKIWGFSFAQLVLQQSGPVFGLNWMSIFIFQLEILMQ